jgi:hypothetical protein
MAAGFIWLNRRNRLPVKGLRHCVSRFLEAAEIIYSKSLDGWNGALHNSPPPADAATQKTPDSLIFQRFSVN